MVDNSVDATVELLVIVMVKLRVEELALMTEYQRVV